MIRILSLAGAAGLVLGATVFSANAQMDHGGHGAHMSGEGASHAYMQSMDKMNQDMAGMKMTGKPGVDFALMMIPHHQSAIDMAKAYLESGEDDAELTRLSEEIIAAQEGEIAFLKDWLTKNRQ
jgi:uncharacterized protein (DUF305 family)